MAILAGPNGALRRIVTVLQSLADVLGQDFVLPLYDQTNVLERYHHGPGLIAFYNGANSWIYRDRAFYILRMDDEARNELVKSTTERQIYEALRSCLGLKSQSAGAPACPQASVAAGLASRLMLIDDIQDEFEAYQAAKARNDEWRNNRSAVLAQTKEALNVWASQHDAIHDSLASCGGFKAIKPSCGNWTEANLRAASEKLKTILPDNTAPEGASQP